MAKFKDIYNKTKTAYVSVSRTKLSDGYNYYLTVFTKALFGKGFVINENKKQTKTILSAKDAFIEARKLLTNTK